MKRRPLLILALALAAFWLYAVEDVSIFDGDAEPNVETPKENPEDAANPGGVPSEKAENLEDFKSTEKIDADVAVPFPVDI